MMTLDDVARFSDTEHFQDAYGAATFYAQVQLFNESVRSGPASRRRIIETGPDVVMPAQRVVKELTTNQVYVMALGSPDFYDGEVIAIKYPALPVSRQFDIKTVAQILSGVGGTLAVWAEPSYIRRVILEERSDYFGGYDMVYSAYFNLIPSGSIFVGGGQWFRTRETSREDDIGLGTAEVVELRAPVQAINYSAETTTTYDPITDSYPGVTPVAVQAFVEPLFLNFQHEVLGYLKVEPGDMAISVLKSAVTTLKPGSRLGAYRVLSVQSNGDVWTAHARRV